MSLLDEARVEINEIDSKMIELFKKRIEAVKKVLAYKLENNLPVFDESREVALIAKNIKILNDPELEKYYLTFFNGVLTSSKDYQKDHYE